MDSIKPAPLKPGDTVAIVSTSCGLPSRFPHVYKQGLRTLREVFGLRIKEYSTARMSSEDLYRQPRLRADDLNTAFADPEVKAILSTIGGDESIRILPYFDPEIARRNPKIFMGYSDTTTQTTFYNQHGLVTFNGPAVMAGFAQLKNVPVDVREHIQTMLFSSFETYEYRPYLQWHNNYADWENVSNTGELGPAFPHDGARWLQGAGVYEGYLFGGCIEVLAFLKGTKYWPEESFWDNRILFLETSEEKPSISYVQRWIRNIGVQGVLNKISGILFGRARDYSHDEKRALEKGIQQVVVEEFGVSTLPIVANLDFGHTDPQWILPLGGKLQIDCERQRLCLIECPTAVQ